MKFHRASTFLFSMVVLSACGGEPSAPAVAPSPTPAHEPESSASAAAATSTTPELTTAAVAVSSTPAPASAPTRGSIFGTVNVMPASLGKNAVVFLVDGPKEPGATMSASIDQKGMNFIPALTIVTAGGKVSFLNSDPFPHNVFSPDHEKFDLGTIAHNGRSTRGFEKPGTYALLCNLHPGMLGYVIVSPSSYFAKADASGHYAIKDVPSGTYKVTAWAARLPEETQSATVTSGDVTLDFHLHR